MANVKRAKILKQIRSSLSKSRITALIGPRQVGKTTLARQIAKLAKFKDVHFFDLEDPTDFSLLENAKLTLEALEGLIVIDEVQRRLELFKYLRVKADAMKKGTKILLLGSSSRDLIEKSSESLARRIQYIEKYGYLWV